MRTQPMITIVVGAALGVIGILLAVMDAAKHWDARAIRVACFALLAFVIAYLGYRRQRAQK